MVKLFFLKYVGTFPTDLSCFLNIASQNTEEKGESEDGSDASKSEISLVYEIALKRNLSVNFEVRHLGQIS